MKGRIGDPTVSVADSQIAPLLGDDRVIEGYRVLTPLLVTIDNPNGEGAGMLAMIVGLGGNSFGAIT